MDILQEKKLRPTEFAPKRLLGLLTGFHSPTRPSAVRAQAGLVYTNQIILCIIIIMTTQLCYSSPYLDDVGQILNIIVDNTF